MDNTQARWLEIQFYQSCINVYQQNYDILNIMEYLDFLKIFNSKLPVEMLKTLVDAMMRRYTLAPQPAELISILPKLGYPIHKVCKLACISKNTYYELYQEKMDFTPRLKPEYHNAIEEFILAQNRWKEGIL